MEPVINGMKKTNKSLLGSTMSMFILCISMLLLLSSPLFYLLTKHYYAEDLIEVMESSKAGEPLPALDLEEDIMHGLMIQYALIAGILTLASIFVIRIISRRLWSPFYRTLGQIEDFRLEDGGIPVLPGSGIKEFQRMNSALEKLMDNSMRSYKAQKEFTENASHELQTPLAVFQGKLDILLQNPDLSVGDAAVIQELYQVSAHLSRLNKDLLLLAKIDNRQYPEQEVLDVGGLVRSLLPLFRGIAPNIDYCETLTGEGLHVKGNRTLLESLINNLVINAIRHGNRGSSISVGLSEMELAVSNFSSEPPLDGTRIFSRFYKSGGKSGGNGLGLAIAKAICDYHGWHVAYSYTEGFHTFTVTFI